MKLSYIGKGGYVIESSGYKMSFACLSLVLSWLTKIEGFERREAERRCRYAVIYYERKNQKLS